MSGFWAKGQNISTALLGYLFNTANYECIVCYEDYKIGDSIAKLKCGHMMHKKCARDWLAHNPTCMSFIIFICSLKHKNKNKI